eukprot:766373-Hanusia_phi.AAC.2
MVRLPGRVLRNEGTRALEPSYLTSVQVCRVKNKFNLAESQDGYRDLTICVLFTTNCGMKIIGEIQIHDKKIHHMKIKTSPRLGNLRLSPRARIERKLSPGSAGGPASKHCQTPSGSEAIRRRKLCFSDTEPGQALPRGFPRPRTLVVAASARPPDPDRPSSSPTVGAPAGRDQWPRLSGCPGPGPGPAQPQNRDWGMLEGKSGEEEQRPWREEQRQG